MRTRKSWREKMEKPDLPRIAAIPPDKQKRWGAGTMVLPAPRDVEDVIRGIRCGEVMTVGEIRRALAAKYGVDHACPLVTGIFVRIAAEAAEEEAREGKTRIAPYWRVVKEDGSLYPKFPGGIARQTERLRAEGVAVSGGRARLRGKTLPTA